ncbi:hypothetical protein HZC31_03175 [Candidatus Woesearchaeota archaeon]|nr:hypothetical protein [Candidatus Woesearchaeota archaeon]
MKIQLKEQPNSTSGKSIEEKCQENLEALKQFRKKYAKNIGTDPVAYKKYIEMC